MRTLISYDVDGGWNEVIDAALANGFQNCMDSRAGWKKLPDTTLIHPSEDTGAVRRLFLRHGHTSGCGCGGHPDRR
ncbi:hypothetical protein [Ferrovibrio xuzhouensis]|uniref:Uncharacterized protein n=1 Tax=Ferrovibrio xuzhouensis TaxID=1576914 RepID=A0ABV7VMC0_9PROT